jgi:septal ring factor EnvC (AmiA/AmiB activator)
MRLTAALQKLARRPLALSALRPGSLRETVYLRAMLETTIPEVRSRTAALRAEIARGQRLEAEAREALAALNASEQALGARRQQLLAIESRQRLESRRASGVADREAERALALAEEARDLDALVARLDDASSLRRELAALPGPIIRPPRPQDSEVIAVDLPAPLATAPPGDFQLPVIGQTVSGFGAVSEGGLVSSGLALTPRPGAQVIAPASGRVAFAGPYRGYERIVIIEHDGGWTSLVTGLARTDVAVGEELVAGAPLGVAAIDSPLVTLELRRDGEPVNPLDYVG